MISGHCGAKHLSSQRDHHTFSKVGQIQHFRVVTPICVFSSERDAEYRRSFKILQAFADALVSADQLSLVFQPRIDLRTGRCVAAEALLRWQHPELGAVPPGEFIPVVERSLHVRDLTIWVLNAALRQARSWLDTGFAMPLSVNVSAANLEDSVFAEQVVAALTHHSISPSFLELEVTESAIMKDAKKALQTLQALREAGIALSIDDFGTGYSSLSYLQKLPTKIVKIDQSFIRDLDGDERGQTLVQSMITLSHDLGYRVVAEGIETNSALAIVTRMECDEAQGYLFTRPIPASQFQTWVSPGVSGAEAAA
ncbi:EAL domain-containing protein [Agrobacterium vitis]|uniref:EAL domain-containing protein n=1 Tax=Agrobacterium vitis TaxID=373 RepID=A0AAE4WJ39_AGRVI|nr:EAL domain-containing protein [Agrobacterium vitis]